VCVRRGRVTAGTARHALKRRWVVVRSASRRRWWWGCGVLCLRACCVGGRCAVEAVSPDRRLRPCRSSRRRYRRSGGGVEIPLKQAVAPGSCPLGVRPYHKTMMAAGGDTSHAPVIAGGCQHRRRAVGRAHDPTPPYRHFKSGRLWAVCAAPAPSPPLRHRACHGQSRPASPLWPAAGAITA